MVQANDLRVGSAKRPISGSRSRELHGKKPSLRISCLNDKCFHLNYCMIVIDFPHLFRYAHYVFV